MVVKKVDLVISDNIAMCIILKEKFKTFLSRSHTLISRALEFLCLDQTHVPACQELIAHKDKNLIYILKGKLYHLSLVMVIVKNI